MQQRTRSTLALLCFATCVIILADNGLALKPAPPPPMTIEQKVARAETIFRGRVIMLRYYVKGEVVDPETITKPDQVYTIAALVEIVDLFVGDTGKLKRRVWYPLREFAGPPQLQRERFEGKEHIFWGRVNSYAMSGQEEQIEVIPPVGYGPESIHSLPEFMKYIAAKYGQIGPGVTLPGKN